MVKQGCDEQKLRSRPLWLGNRALDRITRRQTGARSGKRGMTVWRRGVVPWEGSYGAVD
ncbi:MAG: hypothetical protein GY821_16570 [Gammaproteobacteria bacterium]|nr:hypothetical protein [Gammaproteobacteria bacterium]